jgi:hypothetical protein
MKRAYHIGFPGLRQPPGQPAIAVQGCPVSLEMGITYGLRQSCERQSTDSGRTRACVATI